MKNLTTPRTLADSQFTTGHSSVDSVERDHSRGWYFIYGLLTGWALLVVGAVTLGAW